VLQRQKSPHLVGVYHPRRFDPARDRCCCRVSAPDRQRRDVQHRDSSGSLKQRGEHRRLISDGGVEQRAGHVRYCRRRRHAIVFLKGFGNSISRCLDHGCSAGIPAGILPWRPESYSRGPTEESGHAVIERQRSCGTALRRPEHFADGGYHDLHERAGAVVPAATSSLGRVVVPRLKRARAPLASAVLARTVRCVPHGAGVSNAVSFSSR